MIKPRCGFYLKQESGCGVGIEVYDTDLLIRSLDTPEFKDYCEDLASVYKMKPENVEGMVYLYLILSKAEKLGMSFEEVERKLSSLGLRIEKMPEDQ